ncbi:MAG: RDD family protein [Halorubrum sp.]
MTGAAERTTIRAPFGGETNVGRLARRAGVVVVDALIVGLALALATAVIGLLGSGSPSVGRWGVPLVYLGYYVAFEGTVATTPGKRLLGLVVVGPGGSSCGPRRAAIRTLCRAVDGVGLYLVGFAVAIATEGDRRLGDLAAGTRVVNAEESGDGRLGQ